MMTWKSIAAVAGEGQDQHHGYVWGLIKHEIYLEEGSDDDIVFYLEEGNANSNARNREKIVLQPLFASL